MLGRLLGEFLGVLNLALGELCPVSSLLSFLPAGLSLPLLARGVLGDCRFVLLPVSVESSSMASTSVMKASSHSDRRSDIISHRPLSSSASCRMHSQMMMACAGSLPDDTACKHCRRPGRDDVILFPLIRASFVAAQIQWHLRLAKDGCSVDESGCNNCPVCGNSGLSEMRLWAQERQLACSVLRRASWKAQAASGVRKAFAALG